MNNELLEYLRDMALELSAMAEEGDFKSLSLIFGMAALDADHSIGPRASGNSDAIERHAPHTVGFLSAKDDLGRAALKPEPAN
ncbi:MAG TPA: hypothetical protein VE396_00990 [Xanthobacteraceae bacterium]|jgi:hypothetical protein|nr:hypothetical protein [Xanthobacteraceae bacterium]